MQQTAPKYWQTNNVIQDVQNPMKMSYISFLKTEPNQTDLKIQKLKTRFQQFDFQKTDFGGLGMVFHVVSFTIHFSS